MSYLDRVSPRNKMKLAMHGVAEAATYAVAGYGFGYIQGRYREKASFMNMPADLLAGVALKATALAGHIYGVGDSVLSVANNVGNAGLTAYFHTRGAGAGAGHSGTTRLLINQADVAKAKAAIPHAEVLGDLGKAPHGDFLSSSELSALARG